jgi:hypothetical protein
MATVFEECSTEEQHSTVLFFVRKGHSANDIHKEMFPVYDRKCLSRKTVHIFFEKRGKTFADG